ncbi:MAG: hypothetical protein EXX96DRAFT_571912 [Benjaminiella poitrasii]|nr:MAG: hypothetical protein EXX96DRAFT_571912 [Benjaminiella poitrasii]
MSAIDNLSEGFNSITVNTTNHHSSWLLTESQRRRNQLGKSNRNLQCMPSDEEDEEDEAANSSDSDEEEERGKKEMNKARSKSTLLPAHNKVKLQVLPLPSDEEDNSDDAENDEDDDDDDDLLTSTNLSKKSTQLGVDSSLLFYGSINRSAPSLSHQYEQHNKMQSLEGSSQHALSRAEGGAINKSRSISTDDLSRYIAKTGQDDDDSDDDDKAILGQQLRYNPAHTIQPMHQQQHPHYLQPQYVNHRKSQQHRMTTSGNMSGMDLLIQREQEKAEAKRQKPKIDPGKAKIKGLLGKLPETGTHNINFQQIQKQQQHLVPNKKHAIRQQQQQQSGAYSTNYSQQQYYTPSIMIDYYNNGRASVPSMPMYHHQQQQQQQQQQQLYHHMSFNNLYSTTHNNSLHQQPIIPRPGSAMSSSQLNKKHSTAFLPFPQQ